MNSREQLRWNRHVRDAYDAYITRTPDDYEQDEQEDDDEKRILSREEWSDIKADRDYQEYKDEPR
jgi:hypothetical protein